MLDISTYLQIGGKLIKSKELTLTMLIHLVKAIGEISRKL